MKSRPILFSAPMVRALLAGTKTQTRRVCKPANESNLTFVTRCGGFWGDEDGDVLFTCPYGQPGLRLWVRETLRAKDGFMVYAADDGRIDCDGLDWPACIEPRKTIVSIHMPRWASRLTLEITGVRVERLNDISESDAIAEGVTAVSSGGVTLFTTTGVNCFQTAKDAHAALWESINGPGSWGANPWVWCISFKVV